MMPRLFKITFAGCAALAASISEATTYPPPTVYFDCGSAILAPDQRAKLLREAGGHIKMLRSRGLTIHCIVIKGHADRAGSVERNEKLSHDRAEAVRGVLKEQGLLLAPTRVEAFGEARPMHETSDGRGDRINRRVEVYAYHYPQGCL